MIKAAIITILSLYNNNFYVIIYCISYGLCYGQGHTMVNCVIVECFGKKVSFP